MLKISVLLAVHNGEEKIEKAIQSILSQTFRDFELVVIDDGSIDQTQKIISEIQKKDNRIILESIPHSGLTRALNQGLHLAKGEYIARMDADDIAHIDRLQKEVEFLNQNPAVGVLGTGYEVILENGGREKPNVPLLIKHEEIKKALPEFNPFFHGSTIIRKKLLDQVGGYDENFLLAQDYDLWFRLSKLTRFSNLNEVLMLRHEDVKTIQKEKRQNWFGVKARLKAIREGNSSILNFIYIARPFFVMIMPIWLKQMIRKLVHGKN